ncbi:unnamed protein product [Gadus morhua 'NCC']
MLRSMCMTGKVTGIKEGQSNTMKQASDRERACEISLALTGLVLTQCSRAGQYGKQSVLAALTQPGKGFVRHFQSSNYESQLQRCERACVSGRREATWRSIVGPPSGHVEASSGAPGPPSGHVEASSGAPGPPGG